MAKPSRVGDLEVGQDLRFQRREWLVQRVGWGVLVAFLLAGLLGLLGGGPLAIAETGGDGDPMRLRYERFTRHGAPSALEVRLTSATVGADRRTRFWLQRDFINGLQIQRITPEPESVFVGTERLTYVFPAAALSDTTTILFNVVPQARWARSGRIGLPGGTEVPFGQFVYP